MNPQSAARRGWLALVADGEPFRLCFPLAVLAGWVGVGLWPPFVFGWTEAYPGLAHARVMTEGFVGLALMGFLGTAMPRMLEVPGLTLGETVALAGTCVTAVLLHLVGSAAYGDAVFCLALGLLGLALGARFLFRKDMPPPPFILVLMGLLSGLVGSAMLFVQGVAPGTLVGVPAGVARLLLLQGFPLLPVLGVGAFLLPRFFGLPAAPELPTARAAGLRWWGAAAGHLVAGIAVVASFVVEAAGHVAAGNLLRAVVMGLHLALNVPFASAGLRGGWPAMALRVALVSIPAGFALIAIWPGVALGLLHVVMIQGVSLVILAVASRVLLGHGGRGVDFAAWTKTGIAIIVLMVLATATRVSADLLPAMRLNHYAYAALTWMVAVVLWAGRYLPLVREE